MNLDDTYRPFANVRPWTWKSTEGINTPGIGIMHGRASVVAHLTFEEARQFADRIHDICDANADREAVLPTTIAERE